MLVDSSAEHNISYSVVVFMHYTVITFPLPQTLSCFLLLIFIKGLKLLGKYRPSLFLRVIFRHNNLNAK